MSHSYLVENFIKRVLFLFSINGMEYFKILLLKLEFQIFFKMHAFYNALKKTLARIA